MLRNQILGYPSPESIGLKNGQDCAVRSNEPRCRIEKAACSRLVEETETAPGILENEAFASSVPGSSRERPFAIKDGSHN